MEKIIVTRHDACELLGISMPVLDAFLKREKNPIPFFRTGRKIMIPLDPLRKWAESEAERNIG